MAPQAQPAAPQAQPPAPQAQPPVTLFSGLDLGQAHDPTALAVLERSLVQHKARKAFSYVVRHLERFPIGTAYTAICDRMALIFGKPPLLGTMLVVDRTGVGRAVVDMLARAMAPAPETMRALQSKHKLRTVPLILATLRGVSITSGQHANPADGGGWNVPKRDLVGVLKVLMQSNRLKIVPSLPEAATVIKELQNFKVKITAAQNETYEAWREGDYDDLVLAIAIAVWQAERTPEQLVHKAPGIISSGRGLGIPPEFWR
jgi:hypothetical protein